jgi:LMBR1 domain-containing protein 1
MNDDTGDGQLRKGRSFILIATVITVSFLSSFFATLPAGFRCRPHHQCAECELLPYNMALLQTSLIWVVYAVVVALLLAVASVFIYVYQTPRDRSASVTLTCIISITSLLATVLLLPVDVALVSSTTSSKLGQRKDWATQDVVDRITYSLTIIYYLLYSLDAVLCLLVIPFTYFWYEEYDEVATDTGEQTVGQRIWGALKYTLSFLVVVVILFLVGFFVPVSQGKSDMDLDYFRRLLTENREYLMFWHWAEMQG